MTDVNPKLAEQPPMFVFLKDRILQQSTDVDGFPVLKFVGPEGEKSPVHWKDPPTAFHKRGDAEHFAQTVRRMLSVDEAKYVFVSIWR